MTILISGGGIGGLVTALTCHQIGVPFKVFEAVREIKPLGVGINLQPTAVRELWDLGFKDQLDEIGVRTRDYGMYSKHGLHIWTEPRGTWAGYKWPQYSVHRGALHMMLYDALVARAGSDCIETGWSGERFESCADVARLHLRNRDGDTRIEDGELIIGSDGIHSAIRAQMAPDEGPPKWAGSILWRGTTQAKPFKSGASMVMIGYDGLRFVSYPISRPDPETGLATINWIVNLHRSSEEGYRAEDYSREANLDEFLPQFENFDLEWIDIPGLILGAAKVFEYPMVDRDPIAKWTVGRTTLLGDAAHAAYPVGSNGAGSAIMDARQLGAAFLKHGVTTEALEAYEAKMRPAATKVVLMNRTAGPDSILDVVEERSGGVFDDINDVIPVAEMAAHAEKYKLVAGFGVEQTNNSPPTIPEEARI